MSTDNVDLRRPLCCVTAGSVDDGKSTLIGRLLFDSKALFTDQLEHVSSVSRKRGFATTDLSLVTDGLRAEREQGITIDVGWRYFRTLRRRFVLADSPGHVQYTRNMVTAASHGDVAVIVVDVKRGTTEQTRRHLFVARLHGVPSIVVAVNKMDQVGYAMDAFLRLREEIALYLQTIRLPRNAASATFLPVSALSGDNVVVPSPSLSWFDGPTLLGHLENLPANVGSADGEGRLPVQHVIRTAKDGVAVRGYAGRVASGSLVVGQEVRVMPSGWRSTVRQISTLRGLSAQAFAGQSVVVELADAVDVGRGKLLVADLPSLPSPTQNLVADVAWMQASPLSLGTSYVLKHGTREVRAFVARVDVRYDIASGEAVTNEGPPIRLNELARLALRTSAPLFVDSYKDSRTTGSFLLIDPGTAATLAAGMIV